MSSKADHKTSSGAATASSSNDATGSSPGTVISEAATLDVKVYPHAARLTDQERLLVTTARKNNLNNIRAGVLQNKRITMAQEVAKGTFKQPKPVHWPHAIVRCEPAVKNRLEDFIVRLGYGTIVPTPSEAGIVFVQCPQKNFVKLFRELTAKESSCRMCVGLHGVQGVTGTFSDILKLDFSVVSKLRLHVHPRALIEELLDTLPSSVILSPKDATHVLSVCMAYDRLYYALFPASDFVVPNRNDEQPGVTSWHTLVSKAYNKMNEVLEIEGRGVTTAGAAMEDEKQQMDNSGSQQHPQAHSHAIAVPGGGQTDEMVFCAALRSILHVAASGERPVWALDMGASPGGWSAALSERGLCVVAVDPGEMRIPQLPSLAGRVVHIAKRIEESLDDIKKACGGRQLDLIVCDMNQHPQRSAFQVLKSSDLLRPGGVLVLTCKMLVQGQESGRLVCAQTEEILSRRFQNVQHRFLLNNTHRERTLLAIKKDEASCAPLPSEEALREKHAEQLKAVKDKQKQKTRENSAKKRKRKEEKEEEDNVAAAAAAPAEEPATDS